MKLNRLPKEKLSEIAKGIVQGDIFTSWQVKQQQMLAMVFMPLALGGLAEWTEDERKEVSMMYAEMKDAFPRSMNGYPMFSTMNLVGHKDAKIIWNKVQKMQKLLNKI